MQKYCSRPKLNILPNNRQTHKKKKIETFVCLFILDAVSVSSALLSLFITFTKPQKEKKKRENMFRQEQKIP